MADCLRWPANLVMLGLTCWFDVTPIYHNYRRSNLAKGNYVELSTTYPTNHDLNILLLLARWPDWHKDLLYTTGDPLVLWERPCMFHLDNKITKFNNWNEVMRETDTQMSIYASLRRATFENLISYHRKHSNHQSCDLFRNTYEWPGSSQEMEIWSIDH